MTINIINATDKAAETIDNVQPTVEAPVASTVEVAEYRDEDGVWVSQACDNSGPIRYDGWLI